MIDDACVAENELPDMVTETAVFEVLGWFGLVRGSLGFTITAFFGPFQWWPSLLRKNLRGQGNCRLLKILDFRPEIMINRYY